MDKDYFLLKDKIEEIKSKFLIKNGWLKIYENDSKTLDNTSYLYCCLVSNNKLEIYNKDYRWPLSMGSEGKPSVYGDIVLPILRTA